MLRILKNSWRKYCTKQKARPQSLSLSPHAHAQRGAAGQVPSSKMDFCVPWVDKIDQQCVRHLPNCVASPLRQSVDAKFFAYAYWHLKDFSRQFSHGADGETLYFTLLYSTLLYFTLLYSPKAECLIGAGYFTAEVTHLNQGICNSLLIGKRAILK